MNIVRFQGADQNVYYEFDRDSNPLGEGGMGRIYQGIRVDTSLNIQNVVAIKCIRPDLVTNPTVIQRAQKEASIQIDHDNLIRMYGFFSGAEYNQYAGAYTPAYYICMERLVGVNLDEILFKGITQDKSGMIVPVAEDLKNMYAADRELASLSVMRSVMSGVACLHSMGFIHRDIDPSNVMLTREGNTKVIDFGICKRIGDVSYGAVGLTRSGQFLGKVAYAAPELLLGDLKSQGPATDIYALGIMLFQLLTGFLPVSGSDQEVMDAHLKGKLDYSAVSNRKLKKIIQTATQKEPQKRFASIADFIRAIDELAFDTSRSNAGIEAERKVANHDIPRYVAPLVIASGFVAGVLISAIQFLT